jgi:hypothetical protein
MELEALYVQTHFERGEIEINYQRSGDPRVSCSGVPPFVSDEPDA